MILVTSRNFVHVDFMITFAMLPPFSGSKKNMRLKQCVQFLFIISRNLLNNQIFNTQEDARFIRRVLLNLSSLEVFLLCGLEISAQVFYTFNMVSVPQKEKNRNFIGQLSCPSACLSRAFIIYSGQWSLGTQKKCF